MFKGKHINHVECNIRWWLVSGRIESGLYTHAHWCTHTYSWTHTHTHTHTHTCTYMTCAHAHTHADTCIFDTYLCTHKHTHTLQAHTDTHMHTPWHAHIHTLGVHITTHTDTHINTHTHTHTYTHTHTHTHIHTQLASQIISKSPWFFWHTASILVSVQQRRESRVWLTLRWYNSVANGKMLLNSLPGYFQISSVLEDKMRMSLEIQLKWLHTQTSHP